MSSARPGFTLLEAMIAVVIVGTAGVAVLSAVGAQLRTAERGRSALEAAALAQERLARVELLTAPELEMLPDSLARGAFAAPFARYQWAASVTRVSGEEDLWCVRVTVVWEGGEYPLQTRIYRPKPQLELR